MITLYTGTPGSGKSYNACKTIYWRLKKRKYNNVIANFPINTTYKSKFLKREKQYKFNGTLFHFWDEFLNVEHFLEFAKVMHEDGKEAQTLVVWDEASLYFNSRDWASDKDRKDWLKFLAQHRKFGFEFIFICQDDRQLDRQIRSLVEYEKVHRKANNHKFLQFLPFTLFVCVTRWYALKTKIEADMFFYKPKYGQLYNTFNTFSYV
jgi:zona occludens toxin